MQYSRATTSRASSRKGRTNLATNKSDRLDIGSVVVVLKPNRQQGSGPQRMGTVTRSGHGFFTVQFADGTDKNYRRFQLSVVQDSPDSPGMDTEYEYDYEGPDMTSSDGDEYKWQHAARSAPTNHRDASQSFSDRRLSSLVSVARFNDDGAKDKWQMEADGAQFTVTPNRSPMLTPQAPSLDQIAAMDEDVQDAAFCLMGMRSAPSTPRQWPRQMPTACMQYTGPQQHATQSYGMWQAPAQSQAAW